MRWDVIGRLLLLTSLGCRRTVPTAAANLLAYSEQFANPTWGAGNITVVDNAAIAPDSSQTAARLTETATYSWHGLNQGFAYISGTVVYGSVSMKADQRTKARLKMPPGRREMSLRSSASSTPTEIFVAFAIWRSEIPRRSRASRSLPPKSDVRSAMGRRNRRLC